MIDIKSLTNDDKGRSVVFSNYGVCEFGVLFSWNERFLFVKFNGDHVQACRPEDVEFVYPEKNSDEISSV